MADATTIRTSSSVPKKVLKVAIATNTDLDQACRTCKPHRRWHREWLGGFRQNILLSNNVFKRAFAQVPRHKSACKPAEFVPKLSCLQKPHGNGLSTRLYASNKALEFIFKEARQRILILKFVIPLPSHVSIKDPVIRKRKNRRTRIDKNNTNRRKYPQ